MRRQASSLLVALCCSLAMTSSVRAQEDNAQDLLHRPTASLRVWGEAVNPPAFDLEQSGQRTTLFERLRVGWTLNDAATMAKPGGWVFEIEADLVTGRLVGDPLPALPEHVHTGTAPQVRVADGLLGVLDARKLWAGYTTPIGQLRVGLQGNRWGLGMLANGGGEDDEELFNQYYGGDRVLRFLFATTPLARVGQPDGWYRKLYVALSADAVYRDDNASMIDGDRAAQGILSIFYRDAAPQRGAESLAGIFFVYRDQEDRDGDTLKTWAFNASASRKWLAGDGRWALRAGVEAATLIGDTTRAYPRATPGVFETKVRGVGVAGEVSARHEPSRVRLLLKGGYASGDANTEDDTLYRFRFDPNYRVGLVLFDHYLPALQRASYVRATNPDRSGEPPKGADGLMGEGGVENAIYVNPQVQFGDPEGLLTGVGVLWAVADQPLSDPYATFEQGGTPTNVFGQPAARALGWEVDAAIRYRTKLKWGLGLEVKAEYGLLFPGAAFDDAGEKAAAPQQLARGRVGLRW